MIFFFQLLAAGVIGGFCGAFLLLLIFFRELKKP